MEFLTRFLADAMVMKSQDSEAGRSLDRKIRCKSHRINFLSFSCHSDGADGADGFQLREERFRAINMRKPLETIRSARSQHRIEPLLESVPRPAFGRFGDTVSDLGD
jgi:hypothetical protein